MANHPRMTQLETGDQILGNEQKPLDEEMAALRKQAADKQAIQSTEGTVIETFIMTPRPPAGARKVAEDSSRLMQ